MLYAVLFLCPTENVAYANEYIVYDSREYGFDYAKEYSLERQQSDTEKFLKGITSVTGMKEISPRPAPEEILKAQQVVAELNGLTVGEYKHRDDYKRLVQPIMLLDGLDNACTISMGRILFGTELLTKDVHSPLKDYQFGKSIIADGNLVADIAHETGHSVLGNIYFSPEWDYKKRERFNDLRELDADIYALKTLEKSPYYGWYNAIETALISKQYVNEYLQTPRWELLIRHIESETDGKLKIIMEESRPQNFFVTWEGRNIKDFSTDTSLLEGKLNGMDEKQITFALCQLGYVYSVAGEVNMDNIIWESEDKEYYGTKLVYRDKSLPQGRKVLAQTEKRSHIF